jgi:hypothetical protein
MVSRRSLGWPPGPDAGERASSRIDFAGRGMEFTVLVEAGIAMGWAIWEPCSQP